MPGILRPLRLLVPTLLAALAAGCESATLSPDSVAGTYVLVSYNGNPLPQETASLEHARYYILADTLTLAASGFGTEIRTTRVDYRDPAVADQESSAVAELHYELNDDRLRLSYRCGGPEINCVPGPHAFGRMDGDELVLTAFEGTYRFHREE